MEASDSDPIWLDLHAGSAGVTVSKKLTPDRNRYSFAFNAHADQKLSWAFSGPSVRTLLLYPYGESDGPGLPDIIPLPTSGIYVFTVSSNTMAEHIYGTFDLTLRLNSGTKEE